jgi:hypothetical protein
MHMHNACKISAFQIVSIIKEVEIGVGYDALNSVL